MKERIAKLHERLKARATGDFWLSKLNPELVLVALDQRAELLAACHEALALTEQISNLRYMDVTATLRAAINHAEAP